MAAASLAGAAADPAAAKDAGLKTRAGQAGTPLGITACLVVAGLLVAGVGVTGLLRTPAPAALTWPAPAGSSSVAAGSGSEQTGSGSEQTGSGSAQAGSGIARTGFWPVPAGQIAAPPRPADARLVAMPVWLTIPVIGVNTPLVRLGLAAGGTLQAPSDWSVAGWYTGGPRPGATGPAVIAGHIDSRTGPAVFYRLASLRPGDTVYVRRADRTLVVFRVTNVETYPKTAFPTRAVYDPTPDAELRLITCGGTFDTSTGSYLSNVVVYAVEQPR